MPTDKPRVTFAIDEEKLAKLESYRYDNKIKNQTQAILSLIDKGLSLIESEKIAKKKSPTAAEAAPGEERMIDLYRELNQEGQEKLLDYADDLVASGKYIKSDQNKLGKTKGI